MGFFKNARCGIGVHSGDWEYDRYGACDQSRRCTNCGKDSSRVRHQYGGWGYVEPANEDSCFSERTCGRCDDRETEDRHQLAWRNHRDVVADVARRGPLAVQLLGVMAHSGIPACEQVMACGRCLYFTTTSTLTSHDWGSWRADGRGGSERVCRECGEREGD
jgi:hypothetical protein